jgi:hypothetical protein
MALLAGVGEGSGGDVVWAVECLKLFWCEIVKSSCSVLLYSNIYTCLFLVIIYMNFIYLIRSSSNNYGEIFYANDVT